LHTLYQQLGKFRHDTGDKAPPVGRQLCCNPYGKIMSLARTLRHCTLTSLVASALLLAAPAAMADVILHYTLNGATMESGGTLSGSFDWNATTSALDAFDFTVPTNSYGLASTFDTGNAVYFGPAFVGIGSAPRDSSFVVLLNSNKAYLNLIFDHALAQGGTVALSLSPTGNFSTGSYFSHNDFTGDHVTGGVATSDSASDVPEPATLALFAVGLLPLAVRRRRVGAKSLSKSL
jgi:hypothetical protein